MNTTQSQTKCETMKRERMQVMNTNKTQSQTKCETKTKTHIMHEHNTIKKEMRNDNTCSA